MTSSSSSSFVARHRGSLYAAVTIAAMLFACAWSASYLFDARDAAGHAHRELQTCRAMANHVARLKDRPSGAGPLDQADLHRRSQQALEQLGVSPDQLVQIGHDQPRTIGQSAYKEVPSQLVLRDLTVRQVVGFLLAMTGDGSPLHASSLRLSAPREEGGGTRWAVEITLSYLTYEPPQTVKLARTGEREGSRR